MIALVQKLMVLLQAAPVSLDHLLSVSLVNRDLGNGRVRS
jgi:hypothetical protein